MHSANWDESVDFKDKVVGGIFSIREICIRLAHYISVIGTGSTAIQIVPQIQKGRFRAIFNILPRALILGHSRQENGSTHEISNVDQPAIRR